MNRFISREASRFDKMSAMTDYFDHGSDSRKNDSHDYVKETMAKRIIMNEFYNFGEQTTLHGFRFLMGKRSSCLRRSLWISFILLIYVSLGVGLFSSISKYFSFPVATVVTVNHANVMMFPAVTICNHNQIRAGVTADDQRLLKLLKVVSSRSDLDYDWEVYDQYLSDYPWNLTEVAVESAHRIEDMLLQCRWKTFENCTAENFTTTMTDFGVCYTFNAEGGYSVTSPGSSYGLLLRIDIEQEKYSFSEFTGAGLRVYIHPPNELPLVKMYGFSIAPGFETDVSIRHCVMKILRHPYKPSCGGKSLKYSRVYTADICRYECEVDQIIRACGCKHYRHPGEVRPCDPKEQFHCVLNVVEMFRAVGVANCSCPETCDRGKYQPKISMAQWPSQYYGNYLAETTNYTNEYIRNNFLELNVYFEEMKYEEIRASPAYDFLTLLGDIGGYMGLLCGASLVTIIEVMDCLLVTFARLRNKKQTVSV